MDIETVNQELGRLEKSDIPKPSKERIKEFVKDIRLDGISFHRQYFYAIRLRRIASLIPDQFLKPSKDDIKNVLSVIMEGKIASRTMGKSKTYSDWEIENFKSTLKKFYKWHTGKEKPECINWIKPNNHPNRLKKPDKIVTPDEIKGLVENSKNARDRALLYTLYDSGCRIGEILTLRIKDLAFDDYGALLYVTGKTGYRQVRIVGYSIAYLRAWRDDHPDQNNPEAWLFCGLADSIRGRALNNHDVYAIIRKASNRAKIERRIYPHLFRHTRATLLASKVTEAPLEAQMGWVHGSKQTRTYVHLSGRDQDNAILKAYGVKVDEGDHLIEDRPEKCPRCGTPNVKEAPYCVHCWLPLTVEATIDLKEKQDHIQETMKDKGMLSQQVQAILASMPEHEKTGILTSVVEMTLKQNQEKKQS